MCSARKSILYLAVITKTKTTADDESGSKTPSILLYKQETNSNAHNLVHMITKGGENGQIGESKREKRGC